MDPVVGWKNIPNLLVTRTNTDGIPWKIATNAEGYRTSAHWDHAAVKRILILGDSYAFGEGVDLSDRFDAVMSRHRSQWSILNLGMMGYGTDQEFLAGKKRFSSLRAGDVVLLLTCENDFYDILCTSSAGRPKPWFSLQGETLIPHPPSFEWFHSLRDRSYLMAHCIALLGPREPSYTAETLRNSINIYRALIQAAAHALASKGAFLVIAYHGFSVSPDGRSVLIEDAFRPLPASSNLSCVSLDHTLNLQQEPCLQKDGHWNKMGHELVGLALTDYIEGLS